jgi:hypothetical protein
MKSILYFLMLSMAQVFGASGGDSVLTENEREVEQVQLWEDRLQAAAGMNSAARIEHLWNGLRSMAGRIASTDQSSDVDSMFLKIQQALLATPGHAQHFKGKIEESRSKGTLSRDSYWYLNETLVHLPSPETIKVLGHYLNDERDKPPSPPLHPGTIPYPGTFMRAFEALSKIGLRDLPDDYVLVEREKPAPGEVWSEDQLLEAELRQIKANHLKKLELLNSYRKWWEEVKSGKRTFSFKGQAVEYRFKPDGTWDTLPIANPADDGPPPPLQVTPDLKAEPPPLPKQSLLSGTFWPWIIGGAIALFAAFGFWRRPKRIAK